MNKLNWHTRNVSRGVRIVPLETTTIGARRSSFDDNEHPQLSAAERLFFQCHLDDSRITDKSILTVMITVFFSACVNVPAAPTLYLLNPTSLKKPHVLSLLQADLYAHNVDLCLIPETWYNRYFR